MNKWYVEKIEYNTWILKDKKYLNYLKDIRKEYNLKKLHKWIFGYIAYDNNYMYRIHKCY
jgi:hypothetical protein